MSNVVNLAEKQIYETGELIQFPNTIPDEEVIEKKCTKPKKDGTLKETINNSKRNRDGVYPFQESDIPLMKNYLRNKIESSKDVEEEWINRRNYALFVMGLNIGLRCSDLVSLNWNDIFDKDWNFLDGKNITPKKTKKKGKHVMLKYNDSFKNSILEFKQYCTITNMGGYIFKSREGGHISVDRIGQIIKEAAKEVGIKYNVCSHSMRKTFARVRYDHSTQKDKTLVELMKVFNHASTIITLDYICISEKELEDLYNDVNL